MRLCYRGSKANSYHRVTEAQRTAQRWEARMKEFHGGLKAAHRHSSRHRAEILRSAVCGCFYCLGTFPPGMVEEWVDDGETALCPHCGIDAVIGDASGLRLDDAFLRAMYQAWFGTTTKL